MPVMANIKSQIKRNKQNEKRRVRNKQVRSELRTRVKAAEAGGENPDETLQVAMKTIDKAELVGADKLTSVDGIYGIRVSHNLELTVSGLAKK